MLKKIIFIPVLLISISFAGPREDAEKNLSSFLGGVDQFFADSLFEQLPSASSVGALSSIEYGINPIFNFSLRFPLYISFSKINTDRLSKSLGDELYNSLLDTGDIDEEILKNIPFPLFNFYGDFHVKLGNLFPIPFLKKMDFGFKLSYLFLPLPLLNEGSDNININITGLNFGPSLRYKIFKSPLLNIALRGSYNILKGAIDQSYALDNFSLEDGFKASFETTIKNDFNLDTLDFSVIGEVDLKVIKGFIGVGNIFIINHNYQNERKSIELSYTGTGNISGKTDFFIDPYDPKIDEISIAKLMLGVSLFGFELHGEIDQRSNIAFGAFLTIAI